MLHTKFLGSEEKIFKCFFFFTIYGHGGNLGHIHMKIKTGFSQKPLGHFNPILFESFKIHGNENLIR